MRLCSDHLHPVLVFETIGVFTPNRERPAVLICCLGPDKVQAHHCGADHRTAQIATPCRTLPHTASRLAGAIMTGSKQLSAACSQSLHHNPSSPLCQGWCVMSQWQQMWTSCSNMWQMRLAGAQCTGGAVHAWHAWLCMHCMDKTCGREYHGAFRLTNHNPKHPTQCCIILSMYLCTAA